ncbi:MAG: tetratricopeptide repeat protein [Verrucomicrobia bacterium]|nr:tetratricopeptide repeat protein [Verrucomicrobiota bacterium]
MKSARASDNPRGYGRWLWFRRPRWVWLLLGLGQLLQADDGIQGGGGLAGSASCRECHADFHEKWATSMHGLTVRPYSRVTESQELEPLAGEFRVGEESFRVELESGKMVSYAGGREVSYPIEQMLGGRDVIYFLTRLQRGRLQVLPLGYDVRRREWFDIAASTVRHFVESAVEAVDWREPGYTFNAACYGCHVSHGQHRYHPAEDRLEAAWQEAGISCEACHGPAEAHVRLSRSQPAGAKLTDWGIIGLRGLSAERGDSLCATCHGKLRPISLQFTPGDRLLDHFDVVGLEDLDFGADGRDRGETYTYAGWRMNRCALVGELSCLHCHTSSGRYRFPEANSNAACLPCHAERVANAPAHTRHAAASTGNRCVACHMPRREFARMVRHDHSFRAPMPAVTLAHDSPNACNDCHTDRDAAWAEAQVRSWHARDYQAPVLTAAGLIAEARQQDWRRMEEMIAWLGKVPRDEMFATSLIRLWANNDDDRKWPALTAALADPSPLVRSSAARGLYGYLSAESVPGLKLLLQDEYRLVRIQAAAALARLPAEALTAQDRRAFETAAAEYVEALRVRGDQPEALHDLGHFYLDRGEYGEAVKMFERSLRLRPDQLETLVSAATAHYRNGRLDLAEAGLRRAVVVAPRNSTPRFNLAFLLEQEARVAEAEQAYRETLEIEPGHAGAVRRLAGLRGREE